ncbi:unnamed protein product [Periconia digitata]|uniref:non-specific serine/threonine protein kinase n=1 Tax=Periconia digitata TaxID=1303443 RepID=A0A9W4U5N4_9PLEO|nr:unnamed protein product [Periconia digitata]
MALEIQSPLQSPLLTTTFGDVFEKLRMASSSSSNDSDEHNVQDLDLNPAHDFPYNHIRVRELGDGSEGIVDAYVHKPTGTCLAVKMIQNKPHLPAEVNILRKIPYHESIIHMYGFYGAQPQPDTDCILFEHCSGGDLFDLQKNSFEVNNAVFTEESMWAILRQLSSALAFLHEGVGCADPEQQAVWHPVIHRDIKLENVFVTSFGVKTDLSDIKIKIGDFGLATFYDPEDKRMPGHWGTSILWPPEQTWEGREATPAGDVWAVGCIIHELAHGFPPIEDPELHREQAMKSRHGAQLDRRLDPNIKRFYWEAKTPRWPLPINIDPEAHEFDRRRLRPTPRYSDTLNQCMAMSLQLRMEDRATAGELLEVVEEMEAAYHFRELEKETMAMVVDLTGDDSDDEEY